MVTGVFWILAVVAEAQTWINVPGTEPHAEEAAPPGELRKAKVWGCVPASPAGRCPVVLLGLPTGDPVKAAGSPPCDSSQRHGSLQ